MDTRTEIKTNSNNFQQIISYIPGNVYWKFKDGTFGGCNANVAKILGLNSPAEIVGKTNDDLFEAELARKTTENDEQVFQTGVPFIAEEEGLNLEGKPAIYYSEKRPLYSEEGEIIGLVGISIDITERKRFEEQLQQERIKAEAANIAKGKFLANLSHDIRTPLASLVTLTEHFYKQANDSDSKTKAALAFGCAGELLKLIDEILEFLEVDNTQLTPNKLKNFSLQSLLEKTIALVLTDALQKKLKLSYVIAKGTPKTIYANESLIHRILLNLVNNALKFTQKGEIKISIKPIVEKNQTFTFELSIADTGIGIAQEEQKNIFDKFYRLQPSYSGEQKGYGLGLYIVQQYAEVLNGKLSLQSELGQGSTFTLTFKAIMVDNAYEEKDILKTFCYDESKQELHTELMQRDKLAVDDQATYAAKILLVEDSLPAQHAIKAIFQSLPVRLDIASSGKETLSYIKQTSYDLIILDLGLPDCYGTELAQNIRAYQKQHKRSLIPIVALTAHAREEDLQSCYESGIQQVLRKPLQLNQAEVLLKNWIDGDSFAHHNEKENFTSINIEKAKTLMGGNTALLQEMLEGFINDLIVQKQLISSLFKVNDFEQLREKIHYLNGGASYVGAEKLRMICNSVEAAIVDNLAKELLFELHNDFMEEAQNIICEYNKMQLEQAL